MIIIRIAPSIIIIIAIVVAEVPSFTVEFKLFLFSSSGWRRPQNEFNIFERPLDLDFIVFLDTQTARHTDSWIDRNTQFPFMFYFILGAE